MRIKNLLLNLLPYLFVFISSLYRPYDSDLGWHLKYGQYFFEHGTILKANIFASEMPDFIWPNAAWLTDVLSYAVYHLAGFFGLTLLGALIITLTFFFFSKAFDLTFWEKTIIFPLLVFLENPVNQIGFRGQMTSVMFLGVMMWLLSSYEKGRKKVFLGIIPVFLIWANTHGQFILGLGVYTLWCTFYILGKFFSEEQSDFKTFPGKLIIYLKNNFKEVKFLLLTFVGIIIATLIHPYGWGIYSDAFLHFGNADLKAVMEYLPFEDLTQDWWKQMILTIILFFGILILLFTDQLKKQLQNVGTTSVLYILSWDVRRYAWSLYYLTIPLLKPVANFLKPDSEKNSTLAGIILFVIYIAIALTVKYPFNQYTQMNWDVYCQEFGNCSKGAIEYIRDHNLGNSKLMTMYNWGGYMIWNYPEVKPSIDGRMHLWRDDKGYSAFSEYYAYEQNLKDIDNSDYNVVLMSNEKPVYNRLEQLTKLGKWQKKYEDDFGGVFIRSSSLNKQATQK